MTVVCIVFPLLLRAGMRAALWIEKAEGHKSTQDVVVTKILPTKNCHVFENVAYIVSMCLLSLFIWL